MISVWRVSLAFAFAALCFHSISHRVCACVCVFCHFALCVLASELGMCTGHTHMQCITTVCVYFVYVYGIQVMCHTATAIAIAATAAVAIVRFTENVLQCR